jgi:hypothetical protein
MPKNKNIAREQKAPICEKCPARKGTVFLGTAMGSSLRDIEGGLSRLNETIDREALNVDNVAIIDEATIVAIIGICNLIDDEAAIEKDAGFVQAEYEFNVPGCIGPVTELSLEGTSTHCRPANIAFNNFLAAQE